MQATWTAVYERQDHGWVAYCAEYPDTGVIVGHTLAEARKQLNEVMELVLERQRTVERHLLAQPTAA